jgi:hypothetical protein
MRPVSLALLVFLGLLGIAPADAASDGDVLKKFGMLGTTAVDCAAPPGPSNPYVIFAVSPQGKATRTLKMMDPGLDATLAIRNLRLLAPDTLQFNETGRQSELTITLVKVAGKFRSWRSVRADGTVLIADGKFPTTSKPTLAFTFCR